MRTYLLQCLVASVIACLPTAPAGAERLESNVERDARMAWWREARFGMFIHWGVSAVPAGLYRDAEVNGTAEWIMLKAKIPVAEYRGYAKSFNPTRYDADAWVRLAKAAGMRYIVITSKHHDGFALYDSAVTDWDVVDATPYGRDLLQPLVEACRRHGLKIGFYYSQAQDWVHPGGVKKGYGDPEEGWDPAHRGSFDDYLDRIAVPQVREILSRYDIDVLWWDTPTLMTRERAAKFRPLLQLRPGMLTNNRLVGGDDGDFHTPEQEIPARGLDYDWETCMTMNGSWGYKSYDDAWKSTERIIQNLVDIASKGGNYLLNVGPTALGEIPQPSVDRLAAVGRWMDVNGESIYGTTASPFGMLAWGRCTKRAGRDGATLYLHVFDWPVDGTVELPELRSEVTRVELLTTGEQLRHTSGSGGFAVELPPRAADPIDTVIALRVEGEVRVDPGTQRLSQ